MKLTIKILAVLILAVLASPVFILNGCGKPVNGGQCGSCPDSTAPFGSMIEASTLNSAPNATTGACYPGISFVVIGPDDLPLSDICVEIFTDGASAVADVSTSGPCTGVLKNFMVKRTNASGVIKIDFLTPGGATVGDIFFVQASSCSITATATTPAAE